MVGLMTRTVLLLDLEYSTRERLAAGLRAAGYVVRAGESGDCVVADAALFDDGDVRALRAAGVPVVVTTRGGAVDEAVRVISAGAFGYVPKDPAAVCAEVARCFAGRAATELPAEPRGPALPEGVIGRSPAMVDLYGLVARAAATELPVVILGETGAGKEWVARAVHRHSRRGAGPFVAVNCAALAPGTLESELFGHARGSYTGATSARRGLFQSADGGTIFLDEVAELPLRVQADLLRVIQSGEVRAVGSEATTHADVRVLAATHQDLEQRVEHGLFRRDLLYRLRVFSIAVPPLRERLGDLPALAEYFLARAGSARRLSAEALAVLCARRWRGNVRELRAVIERAAALAPGAMILPEDLGAEPTGPSRRVDAPHGALDEAIDALLRAGVVPLATLEARYARAVLDRCDGSVARAADELRVAPDALRRVLAGPDEVEDPARP
jgi:DNA-binding NtrC family response regulator